MDCETMTDSKSNSGRSGESFDEDDSDNGLSSSSGSTDSSDEENAQQNTLEMAKIANELLKLPRGLCENPTIFKEFFSMATWQLLSENFKTYLMNKHFPVFAQGLIEDKAEREKTVNMLFNNQIIRFGQSPMVELQRNLEEGNYRPDVLKLRQSIAKSRKREQRFQSCERISQLARQLFISRERLLRTAYKSSPAEIITSIKKAPNRFNSLNIDTSISAVRARKRFSTEIKNIFQLCDLNYFSTDESNIESDLLDESIRDSGINNSFDESNAIRNNSTNSEKCIYNTFFKRKHDTLDEDTARAQYESRHPKLNNRNFKQCLLEHKRRKIIDPNIPEFDTVDIRLRDVYTRAQVGGNFKRIFPSGKTPGRKPKSKLKAMMPALPPLPLNSNSEKCTGAKLNSDFETKSTRVENKLTSARQLANPGDETMENKEELQQKLKNIPLLLGTKMELESSQNNQSHAQHFLQSSTTVDVNLSTGKTTIPSGKAPNQILQQQSTHAQRFTDIDPIKDLWADDSITTTLGINSNVENSGMSQVSPLNPGMVMQSNLTGNSSLIAQTLVTDSDNDSKKQSNSIAIEDAKANESHLSFDDVNDGSAMVKQMIHSTSGPELLQETHACFFSLLRDFFCSTPNHRMKFDELREKVNIWLCNPITALNDWYLLADSWSALLTSGINFLAGDFAEQPEEYVPYIEYKTQQNIYQWIGAGRDSDARLSELSNYWLSCRNKLSDKGFEQKIETSTHLNSGRRSSIEIEEFSNFERGISPPPPPRCPTTWTVVAATPEEVMEFQHQERERFENPHRAFTYRMHGYESVVGPVKGIYTQILALTKARGHSMMIGDRPNFVTILTLVRDATARLPNGEGTRADISELLKCSQYINRDAAENVLQTIVSGALDRMHTEHDPCVRYDPKRKIWIYLHRNRSEDDFERMHQQYQGLGKHKKPTNRKTKPKILKETNEADFVCNAAFSTASIEMQTTSNATNSVFPLPALVPSNPVIVNSSLNQQIKLQQHQQLQLAKCPPVPPLKYNIQPLQHQQKSLLKSTLTPSRSFDSKKLESSFQITSKSDETGATFLSPLQSNSTNSGTSTVTQTNSIPSSLITFPNKSLSFTVATSNTSKVTNMLSNNNTTPIIVATPTGLKTVHVSKATSNSSPTATSPALQLVKSDARGVHASTLSATVGGKKVALNKPIIINQITQQTQVKSHKSSQSQLTKPLQKSQQQNFVIPAMHLNSSVTDQKSNLFYEKGLQTTTKDSLGIQTVFMESSKASIQEGQVNQTQTHNKNIIRILPGTATTNKSIVAVPVAASVKQPAHIIGQRIVANASSLNSQTLPKSLPSISMISNNNNNNNISSTSNTSGGNNSPHQLPTGAIVRMSSQAFASLQQKQQTQQNVIVKNTPTFQNRVIMGRSTINASLTHSTNKNIIVQQVPCTLMTTPKPATHAAGQNKCITTKGVTSVINITPQVSNTKIQTINTSNLTGPQQKILLQNLKQQSMQFKTVQVVPQQQQQQQSQQSRFNSGGQNLTKSVTANTLESIVKSSDQQTKSVTVSLSQPQTLAKTVNTQVISKDIKGASNTGTELRNMNNTPGQVISLEGLLGKQQTLRMSNASTMAKVSQGSNIIQLQSTQTGTNPSVFTAPLAMSVGQIKDTTKYVTTGTKIIASPGNANAHIKAPQMVNTNVFGKVSGNTSPAGGFKIISSGGVSTNFNIANIQGKQVILASKPTGTISAATAAAANHNQRMQNSAIFLSGPAAKLHGNPNVKLISKTSAVAPHANTPHLQTILVGNQLLRIDQLPSSIKQQIQTSRIAVSTTNTIPLTVVANASTETSVINSNVATILPQATGDNMPKTFILGSSGQKIRFQSPATQPQQAVGTIINKTLAGSTTTKNVAVKPPTSRVVLAVQGGGQIFLSPNYQGSSVNFKSLQNVKVVSMGQANSLAPHDNQHQERNQKESPQRQLSQQSILRATSGSIEKS